MPWLVHNNVEWHTPHTLPLVAKAQVCCWEGNCTTAIWSSGFLGWVETTHFSASSHFIAVSHIPCYPYMLLCKGLLSYFFCCFIHVHFYSYFIRGSVNISSTNLCSTDKNCFAYFYLAAFAYSSSFFFPALLPPFSLSWHANIRCPNLTSLMERFVKHSSLGGKKKRESMRSFAVRQV